MVPVSDNIAELRAVKLQVQIKLLIAFVGVKRPAGKKEVSLLRILHQAPSASFKNAHSDWSCEYNHGRVNAFGKGVRLPDFFDVILAATKLYWLGLWEISEKVIWSLRYRIQLTQEKMPRRDCVEGYRTFGFFKISLGKNFSLKNLQYGISGSTSIMWNDSTGPILRWT